MKEGIVITPTSVTVSYSIGVKCNGNFRDANGKVVQTYESVDGHFSRTKEFPIPPKATEEEVDAFADAEWQKLKNVLDKKAEEFYAEHSFFAN
jgi:hypothetical protein